MKKKISGFDFSTLSVGIIMASLVSVICMQIIGKIGTTPNTSLIGALTAILISKIPFIAFKKLKSLERQNYIQTMVSGAGFTAANIGLLCMGLFFILGEITLLLPMALGALLGTIISILVLGKIFDSSIFPAEASWPPGIATANAIQAGDESGAKGFKLIQGIIVGMIGSFFNIPVAGFGIGFLSNIPGITALALGLIIRGYSLNFFSINLATTYIPQGFMLGAGCMALIQCLIIIFKKKNKETINSLTVTDNSVKKTIFLALIASTGVSLLLSFITGIYSQMSMLKLISWIIFAGFSAIVTMLLVGMAAMHSGWFPAFAITTIFITISIFLGFPPISIAVLTGYISSVGPCFADMGFDLKAGWILRGRGANKTHEIYGRKQQVYFELFGSFIGIIMVILTMNIFFKSNLFPPVTRVFSTTITAVLNPSLFKILFLWSIPGFIVQLLGKTSNMVGVLFATGLLISNPNYGIGILVAVIFRLIFGKEMMEMRDAGLIVGDGLYGFLYSLFRVFK